MSQNFRIGVFLVLTLAALAIGVFLIGNQQSMFKSHYRIKAEYENIAGLQQGADVRVGGIRKGTVRLLQLPAQPGGKVTLVIELTKDTQRIIKRDSEASILSEGLLGDKYVEVSFGPADSPKVTDEEAAGSQPPI